MSRAVSTASRAAARSAARSGAIGEGGAVEVERSARFVHRLGIRERRGLPRADLQRGAVGGDGVLQRGGVARAGAEVARALPRLFWVMAQSIGLASRV
jgi:hypothetical protein